VSYSLIFCGLEDPLRMFQQPVGLIESILHAFQIYLFWYSCILVMLIYLVKT